MTTQSLSVTVCIISYFRSFVAVGSLLIREENGSFSSVNCFSSFVKNSTMPVEFEDSSNMQSNSFVGKQSVNLDQLSRLNTSVLPDHAFAKKVLNSFYQFKDKKLYREYLLYNLNTKPYTFLTAIICLYTFLLFPIKLLYYIYFIPSSMTPALGILNVIMMISVTVLVVTGWIIIFKKHQASFSLKRFLRPFRRFCSHKEKRKTSKVTVVPTNFPDGTSISANCNASSVVVFNNKNKYSAREPHQPHSQPNKHYLGHKYAVLQHVLGASMILFNVLVLINLCVGVNCVDYHNPGLNTLLRNCTRDTAVRGERALRFVLCLMLTPILFTFVFKECLFEFHLANHFFTMICIFSFSWYYSFTSIANIAFVLWMIMGFLLIVESHVQNVASFLTYYELKEILLEKERLTEQNNATEMRHMIGNVAHDLKTVSRI
jgi:hypothetical protein